MNGALARIVLNRKLKLIQPPKWMLAFMSVPPTTCIPLIVVVLKQIFQLLSIKPRNGHISKRKRERMLHFCFVAFAHNNPTK